MPKGISFAELEALYEMIVTRKDGRTKHYRYASIVNGKLVDVTARQFFRLEKKITKKETKRLMETI